MPRPSPKRFINDRDTVVTEALDGLVALAGGRLVRLDGYPHVKVVLRASLDPSKVALLSGGGAGHEPAHAGFVGAGMLSAAVSGDIFASPSVEAVYAGIMACCGEAGCLMIVKNYTGDRLNFGLAAERARAQGKRVEMVIVADDTALPGSAQPRGVAGTLFVHKLAGHLAEQGADLETVAKAARAAAGQIGSLGVSLDSCTIPGQPTSSRLAADEGELGLGIHGEPGIEKIALGSVRAIVWLMIERLAAGPLPAGEGTYALLLNNLGAVPAMEMLVIAHEVLSACRRAGLAIERVVGPAPLMTALDMNGFSISLLALNPGRLAALDADCEPPAWPGARAPVALEGAVRALSPGLPRTVAAPSSDPRVEGAVRALLRRLIAMQAELDALDAKIGDGDTGTTFARAARALEVRLDALPFAEPGTLLAVLSEHLAETMGGSSGVLMSIFCRAASSSYAATGAWGSAMGEGLARIQEYGGAGPGDRTMIDALAPALAALSATGSLGEAVEAAREGAEATASMERAKAGRAAYLSRDSLAGVPDPGAVAVAAAFEAVHEALGGSGA